MALRKRIIEIIGRNKFRIARGQGWIGLINTILLLILTLHLGWDNTFFILGIGIGTLFCVWLIGRIDEKMGIVHAESDHNVLKTTPFFQEVQKNLNQTMEDVKRIREILEKE